MATQLSDIVITPTSENDLPAIIKLHTEVFGPGRFVKTAYRVREGQPPISPFCRIAKLLDRQIIATVTFTRIHIGTRANALLLGPLVVKGSYTNIGIGRQLISEGLLAAKAEGVRLVVLVGDFSYYERFGFIKVQPGQILFPGPAAPKRILAYALDEVALNDYQGLIRASKHHPS